MCGVPYVPIITAFQRCCSAVVAVTVPLLLIDLSFFAANIVKIVEGGWFPLVVAITVYTLMTTWHTGRVILNQRLAQQALSVDDFLRDLKAGRIPRVPGTAWEHYSASVEKVHAHAEGTRVS